MDNTNSKEFWDNTYKAEMGSGKRRIDNERWQYVTDTMRDYMGKNPNTEKFSFLDVGCGNGEMMRLVHAVLPEWRIFGIDITPDTLRWASTVDSQFEYKEMSATDIALSSDFFDVVFCGETLEHLEDPQTAVYQMQRVLKPEGYLICSVPNEGNNRSPEHLREFTVFDALKLTTGGDMTKLVNVNVKVSGISTIWTSIK